MIWWMALLFAGGIALVFAEFILPGAVLGVAGVLMLVGCAGLALVYFPDIAVFVIIVEILSAILSIGLGMYILAKTDIGRSLRLDKSQAVEDGYSNQESDLTLLGKQGVVLTALRPAGTIVVEDQRLDAVSSGAFINKGDSVSIIEVHGNRVVVEKSA